MNLWLGDDRSTTALHKDNYENIYVQIRGQKHFVLMPPVEMPCVYEQLLHRGRYVPRPHPNAENESGKADRNGRQSGDCDLEIQLDASADLVPIAIWDPDEPEQHPTAYSHLAKPLRVTLREGDMLYLPSMWYHKVSQRVGDEGFVCAVNYWYDMEFAGEHWTNTSFVRDVYNAERRRPEYPEFEMGDSKS